MLTKRTYTFDNFYIPEWGKDVSIPDSGHFAIFCRGVANRYLSARYMALSLTRRSAGNHFFLISRVADIFRPAYVAVPNGADIHPASFVTTTATDGVNGIRENSTVSMFFTSLNFRIFKMIFFNQSHIN
jgi:hypothetical protein